MRPRLRNSLETLGVWTLTIVAILFDWLPRRIAQAWREHRVNIVALIALMIFGICYWTFRATYSPMRVRPVAPKQQQQYIYYFPFVCADCITASLSQKKGVGLTYGVCNDTMTLGAVWQYGWATQPANCPDIENVPMIWGAADILSPIGGNSQWLMGFNEPDLSGQANISPADAVMLWRQIEDKYPDRKLVAPAPSQLNPDWIVKFRDEYIARFAQPPRLDALAAHCYSDVAQDCIDLVAWYEAQAQQWGVDGVWLTEFAILSPSSRSFDDTANEIDKLMQYLEGDSMVARYAWFAARVRGDEWFAPAQSSWETTSLIDVVTNKTTPLGRTYRKAH